VEDSTLHVATEVVDNARAAEGIRRLALVAPPGWEHRPGQVAALGRAPGPTGYFAIATAPHEPSLAFLIKEGPDTLALTAAEPGAGVMLAGPHGPGFALPDPALGERLVFVGAGTALAALRSGLVAALRSYAPSALALVIGVRRPRELAFADELDAWSAAGVEVRVVASRAEPDWRGPRGWVQDHLGTLLGPWAWVFVAGSEALEDAVEAAALGAGVLAERVQRNYRPDRRSATPAGPTQPLEPLTLAT